MTRTGQCICGAVRFTCRLKHTEMHACHCTQCQRWRGGGPLINVSIETLDIEDETTVSEYRASTWGSRCFCRQCGLTLFWKMQGKAPKSLAVGLLDDQSGLTMKNEIFVDYRPCWLPVWADADQSTEAQEFAKLKDYLEGEKNDQV